MTDRHVTRMTLDDAEHYTPAQKAAIIASYPEHEKDARTKGIPTMGSGRIFPYADETISCPPIQIPRHWVQLGAMDFGWDHPFAGVKLAWDRDADCVYVTNAYRESKVIPAVHAAALMPWGELLPWAWPADGLNTEKGSGEPLRVQYVAAKLKLLAEHAQFEDGSTSVEAGLLLMNERMQTGRFKVFAHLTEWFGEFRLYHRQDGKVVKKRDDLMSATRYGVMSLRHARRAPTETRLPARAAPWDPYDR